jgi:cytochrome c oxidase accessory protein FixG
MATELRKQPNLDSVTTINRDGSHYYLHTADVKGKWTFGRRWAASLLIAVYVLLPWLRVNGSPALFFDVESRQFHVFGLTLVPQDLWVMFFGITGLGFMLFFVTSLLGRLWCGWACPYTVFLDHVFRRIERWTEGDAVARRRLDAAPWTASKWLRRGLKHSLYLLCATLIAHVFLSYFVSIPRLYQHMQEGPLAHATAFGAVLFLTLILWFCFGWFREQFCAIMCPYGRLQSALTDDDTVVIGYDEKRGEPRGPKGKTDGSCIDCRRCVNVCPTGIDIRDGLQLECIGCAACIDACDDVMTLVGRPRGLVRYDSLNGLQGRKRRILRPRLLAYTILGLLGLTVFSITAWRRAKPFTADFSRMRGTMRIVLPSAIISTCACTTSATSQPTSPSISAMPRRASP